MNRAFQMVDVFSEQPYRGNPLAVLFDAEDLSTEEMVEITRWMNLSETTFLLPPTNPKADYRVRIFTLERELPFAGHPTLGTCHAWLLAGGKPRSEEIVQECGAGLIPLRRIDSKLAFAAPPVVRSGPVDESKVEEIAKFLRIDRSDIVDSQWVDNGPGWIAVLLESAQAVIDVKSVRDYPRRIDVGVVGPYPKGSPAAFELRALFTDQHGTIIEDPVTGSLNASVAQWLLGSGRVTAPFTASQGTCLGRRGRIQITQDASGQVWVGGHTATLFSGRSGS